MMDTYSETKYIYLHPGDFYFGDCHTRMRTLLGSCVSIMAWHPELKIGGMCHYILPSRFGAELVRPDGRYAEEAVMLLLNAIAAADTLPAQYRVRLAGGGSMFRGSNPDGGSNDIPRQNMEAARRLVRQHGFRLDAENMGGFGHRQVLFDVGTGDVWVKHNTAAFCSPDGLSQ